MNRKFYFWEEYVMNRIYTLCTYITVVWLSASIATADETDAIGAPITSLDAIEGEWYGHYRGGQMWDDEDVRVVFHHNNEAVFIDDGREQHVKVNLTDSNELLLDHPVEPDQLVKAALDTDVLYLWLPMGEGETWIAAFTRSRDGHEFIDSALARRLEEKRIAAGEWMSKLDSAVRKYIEASQGVVPSHLTEVMGNGGLEFPSNVESPLWNKRFYSTGEKEDLLDRIDDFNARPELAKRNIRFMIFSLYRDVNLSIIPGTHILIQEIGRGDETGKVWVSRVNGDIEHIDHDDCWVQINQQLDWIRGGGLADDASETQ